MSTKTTPPAKKPSPKTPPRKAAWPKGAPVRAASKPASEPVRVVAEPVLAGGSLWKMSGRNGVAYVRDAALAGELLRTDLKNLTRAAMAVYYDKKGRAFAWQVRFDTERWEEVVKRLG